MVDEANIEQCFIDAAKRKTNHPDVAAVLRPECFHDHVKALQKILTDGTFVPPPHRKQKINEHNCGKEREIIKPEYKYEQVVHHCIIKILQPIVIRGLYEHALGSIPNKGAHSGKKTIEKWIRGYKGKKFYILKGDVRHCFRTEDIHVIESKLGEVIKDEAFLDLCAVVLESEAEWITPEFDNIDDWTDTEYLCGLPLGFVTSQWFTQLNFKRFDHMIMEDWHKVYSVDHYMRYMDDIVIFSRNKKQLHRLKDKIEAYLQTEMHQKLKGNWQVFRFEYTDRKTGKVRGRAIDFMGFVFHRNRTTMRKTILLRSTRKARRIAKKERITWYDACAMLSYIGWYDDTDTYDYYERSIKPLVNVRQLKKIVSRHSKKGMKPNDYKLVSVGKHGSTAGMGHNIIADNGLSASKYPQGDARRR